MHLRMSRFALLFALSGLLASCGKMRPLPPQAPISSTANDSSQTLHEPSGVITPTPGSNPTSTPNTSGSSDGSQVSMGVFQFQFEKAYFDPQASADDFKLIAEDGRVIDLGKTLVGSTQALSLRMRLINTTTSVATVSVVSLPAGVQAAVPTSIPAKGLVESGPRGTR